MTVMQYDNKYFTFVCVLQRYYVKDINAGSGSEGEAIEEVRACIFVFTSFDIRLL